MDAIPEPLQAFCVCPQFILWKLAERDGKPVKLPVDHRSGDVANALDPAIWMDAQTALAAAAARPGHDVGFVFTNDDPFFFLDIDDCLMGETWSPLALEVLGKLPGAAVEISQSGRGLHVFGAYTSVPEHSSKNIALGLELYTADRFVALTGTGTVGLAALDCTEALAAIIQEYFTASGAAVGVDQEWTDKPVAAWAGIEGDDALIEKARSSESSAAVFAGAATFRKLWEADEDALGVSYPDPNRAYDASSADLALAQHLAFWTGSNCARMWDLMWRSELKREKWNREDYLVRTILKATSRQDSFHNTGRVNNEIAEAFGGPKLKASSDKQRNFATNVRAEKLAACNSDEALIRRLCISVGLNATAKFWLDNRDKTPQELAAMITPLEIAPVANVMGESRDKSGYQYLSVDLQKERFEGCCYIQDRHGIFVPDGAVLSRD